MQKINKKLFWRCWNQLIDLIDDCFPLISINSGRFIGLTLPHKKTIGKESHGYRNRRSIYLIFKPKHSPNWEGTIVRSHGKQ